MSRSGWQALLLAVAFLLTDEFFSVGMSMKCRSKGKHSQTRCSVLSAPQKERAAVCVMITMGGYAENGYVTRPPRQPKGR